MEIINPHIFGVIPVNAVLWLLPLIQSFGALFMAFIGTVLIGLLYLWRARSHVTPVAKSMPRWLWVVALIIILAIGAHLYAIPVGIGWFRNSQALIDETSDHIRGCEEPTHDMPFDSPEFEIHCSTSRKRIKTMYPFWDAHYEVVDKLYSRFFSSTIFILGSILVILFIFGVTGPLASRAYQNEFELMKKKKAI